MEWSHALLEEGEKVLFARLSVFAGDVPSRPWRPSATRRATCPWTFWMA